MRQSAFTPWMFGGKVGVLFFVLHSMASSLTKRNVNPSGEHPLCPLFRGGIEAEMGSVSIDIKPC